MVEEPALIYPRDATELENVPPPLLPREAKMDLQVFSGKAPHEQKNAYNRVYSYSISEDAIIEVRKLRRRTNILFSVMALLILLVLVLALLAYFLFFRSLSTTKSEISTQVANSSRHGLLADQTKPPALFTTSPRSPKTASLVSLGERREIPLSKKDAAPQLNNFIEVVGYGNRFIRYNAGEILNDWKVGKAHGNCKLESSSFIVINTTGLYEVYGQVTCRNNKNKRMQIDLLKNHEVIEVIHAKDFKFEVYLKSDDYLLFKAAEMLSVDMRPISTKIIVRQVK